MFCFVFFEVGVVNYNEFFNLRAATFHFTKYKKTFLRKGSKVDLESREKSRFFLFSKFVLKSALGGPIYYY